MGIWGTKSLNIRSSFVKCTLNFCCFVSFHYKCSLGFTFSLDCTLKLFSDTNPNLEQQSAFKNCLQENATTLVISLGKKYNADKPYRSQIPAVPCELTMKWIQDSLYTAPICRPALVPKCCTVHTGVR